MATHIPKVDLTNTNLFEQLHINNLVKPLRDAGYLGRTHKINPDTNKIEPILLAGHDTATPWVHVNQDPNRQCDDLEIIFKTFGFVPDKCLQCWKVVVRPKTLFELMQLLNLQIDMNKDEDVHCKCGMEVDRPYVSGHWGGYFYNDSKSKGLDRLNQVRKLVSDNISPDIKVILKRYCTEFELRFGNSKGYNQPRHAKHWQAMMDKYWTVYPKPKRQSELVITDVIERWIRHADYVGDTSMLMFNNQEHLYTQVQTYEEEDR
jgi:hypothetical protein